MLKYALVIYLLNSTLMFDMKRYFFCQIDEMLLLLLTFEYDGQIDIFFFICEIKK